ncbi:MAG TPA: TonB-dependent receptor [Chitinophagaceae bacterium]
MLRNGCILGLVCLMMGQLALAQSTIRGQVKNDQEVLSDVSVLLLQNADSSLVKGQITDKSGNYSFNNVSPGKYILRFSRAGYKNSELSTEVSAQAPQVDLGSLSLARQPKELKQVEISARKPLFEQKVDRTVVNVKSSITAAGLSALDILERSPGVNVNRQDNMISMAGKNGVMIMINGKLMQMPASAVLQMLSGMSAGNIEKIELITSPPANYDAEGNAGYINIVLVGNPNAGTNGIITATAGYGKGPVTDGSLNFNHRAGKFNIYGDYSFSRRQWDQPFDLYRRVVDQGVVKENDSYTFREAVQRNHFGRLGLDYSLSKKTIIGAMITGYDNKWSMDAVNDAVFSKNGVPDTVVNIVNDEINQWKNLSLNFNLNHNFSADQRLAIDLDYLHYEDNNPVNYRNTYYNGSKVLLFTEQTKSEKLTPISMWIGKADYTKKINRAVSLEAGIKGGIYEFTNDVRVSTLAQNSWKIDTALTAKYLLKEKINAAYAAVSIEFNPRTNMKVGLRYEHTNSNLGTTSVKNIIDRSYGNLFPSFFFTRKLAENKTLNFSYSRRITRPTFNDMAPFVIFMDPNTFFSGNPGLQPAIADGVTASYTHKRYLFSLGYSYESSPIARFQQHVDPKTNKLTFVAENLKNASTVAATISVPITISNKWTMQNNIQGIWMTINTTYVGKPLHVDQKYVDITTIQNITLPRNFAIEVVATYKSASLWGSTVAKATGALNFGVQKKFTGSSLKLNVADVFNTNKLRLYNDYPEHNIFTSFEGQFFPRTVRLTFTKNFGNKELKSKRARTTSLEEEKRVN